jgi:chitin disaccharide deacetylase
MMAKLIVNADDYGHTPGVSRGIREAHLRGIVTSTTSMMNMAHVKDALQQAMSTCPGLGLGVHLVLTTGSPVLPVGEVNTLVDSDGCFWGEEGLIARIDSIDLQQVRKEWTAQVEKFISITGEKPDHLDSHHHAAYYSLGLCEIHLQLAQKYGCAVRFPTVEVGMDILGGFSTEYAQTCSTKNQELIRQYKIAAPDTFFKTFYDDTCNEEYLVNAFSQLSEGTTEMMCHPGYADPELLSNSTYTLQRQNELGILTNKMVIQALKTYKIELQSFGSLKNR